MSKLGATNVTSREQHVNGTIQATTKAKPRGAGDQETDQVQHGHCQYRCCSESLVVVHIDMLVTDLIAAKVVVWTGVVGVNMAMR